MTHIAVMLLIECFLSLNHCTYPAVMTGVGVEMTEDVCCCAASAADATFRESRPGFTSSSSSATPDSTSSTLKCTVQKSRFTTIHQESLLKLEQQLKEIYMS